MIASVRGPVLAVGLDFVVVEVGGVGLLVHTTPGTAAAQHRGSEARFATSLVVREDALTLYGFADDDEKSIFETVMSVSGVGPRLALAMLTVHRPDAVRAAVGSGDVLTLTKVPGIGKKGAERLVLELRDKIGVARGGNVAAGAQPATAAWQGQVHEALVGLGWTARQADEAVDKVTASSPAPDATVSSLLRAALQVLGR